MYKRQLNRLSKLTFEAFPGSFNKSPKIHTVGNPVRSEIIKSPPPKPTIKEHFNILILGGSQGSRQLNEIVLKAFKNKMIPSHWHIVHQIGDLDRSSIVEAYSKQDCNYEVIPYITNIGEAYHQSDLVIGRSGAMTISEICCSSKPSILLPLPWATDNHQYLNAKFLEDKNASIVLESTLDSADSLFTLLNDLEKGLPMDRLICGDVGFGKTEIALRASFLAAMSGKQVSILAPTTLLARQHYETFKERFKGFPINVFELSRLTSKKDSVVKSINSGSCDIVIGTHSLLGEKINFSDLGLLIIDEEQHFGVKHKEKIKKLRDNVHVLTLTATPIPRTLQLAMTGVRDLSIIASPPIDRRAIETYVFPNDPLVVKEALLRERHRGGQSFYVVPRISDIEDIEEYFKEFIPEINYITCLLYTSPSPRD